LGLNHGGGDDRAVNEKDKYLVAVRLKVPEYETSIVAECLTMTEIGRFIEAISNENNNAADPLSLGKKLNDESAEDSLPMNTRKRTSLLPTFLMDEE